LTNFYWDTDPPDSAAGLGGKGADTGESGGGATRGKKSKGTFEGRRERRWREGRGQKVAKCGERVARTPQISEHEYADMV